MIPGIARDDLGIDRFQPGERNNRCGSSKEPSPKVVPVFRALASVGQSRHLVIVSGRDLV
jgi:hypothetical protein